MTDIHSQADPLAAGSISSNKNHEVRTAMDDEKAHQVPSSSSSKGDDSENEQKPPVASGGLKVPSSLQWIPANCTWSKVKPVIRCAVAAWIATILFVIPRVEIFMGQVN
jgi:hypothetical protein